MIPKDGREAIEAYLNQRKVGFGMSTRPEYYSNRGPTPSDLSHLHLEALYKGLVGDFGQEAGDAFCNMIDSLTDLSATNFLNQFYRFFDRGRKWDGVTVKESGIDIGPDNPCRMGVAFATIAGAFSRGSPESDRRMSRSIQAQFFAQIGQPKRCQDDERRTVDWSR